MGIKERRQAALDALEKFYVDNGIQNRDHAELPGYDDGDGYMLFPIIARSDDADWWQPGYKIVGVGYRGTVEEAREAGII